MKPILTLDFETDPFKYKRIVKPFACGVYNGKDFASVWHERCAERIVKYLKTLPPSIIFMHNGGRFDIFFLLQWLGADMVIINGRIVKAMLGLHEIRDSYAILPVALSQYKKDDIDINKLHRDCREVNREEILSYLRGDCVYLYELVSSFFQEFGDYLTIGSAAMGQLKKFHPFARGTSLMDRKFRGTFFYGGRVQCFKPSGIYNTNFSIYDVNSMYPYVMKNFRHPNGDTYDLNRKITPNTAFIVAEGINKGAFPFRTKKGIDFVHEEGTFNCSIHEWNAAERTKTFKPFRVLKTYEFRDWISFDAFVDHFYDARMKAKSVEDKIHEIFYKLILNSAYGKFAQNPANFFDYAITQYGERKNPDDGWREKFIHNEGQYVIWDKPVQRHTFYNVAIGASITGAARSVLLDALSLARNPLYCDTDSIIAQSLDVEIGDKKLGAWKHEGSGNRISIAGKKMYACYDGDTCIKKATKGARLKSEEIDEVARGGKVTFYKDAPTFKLDGRVEFIKRDIRATV